MLLRHFKKLSLAMALVFSNQLYATNIVEEWLLPAVDLEYADGSWKVIAVKKLPRPPFTVLEERGDKLRVNIRRVGLVWVGRSSVRLSNESIVLSCQDTQVSRARDFQNFGMRGNAEETSISCLDEGEGP
ncbi:hypothetical protein [Vibrio sp. HN007]|uniref:hypothetical protein n=1 Tax=Vibrio iocasae TaxID=3098914 RepID=UPI0035D48E73